MSVTHTTEVEEKPEISLSSEQKTAVDLCCDLDEPMVGVTGSAGTGKTVVLGKVHEALIGKSVVLAAPTGRAAKRITELTGIPARTIHRLLEFPQPGDKDEDGNPPPPNVPRRDAFNPLPYRVVMVDEASMVSSELMNYLEDAMPPGGVIRLFGDNNQLSPVEDNSGQPPPFINVITRQPSVTLTWNFRSDDEIVSNANLILKGRMPHRNSRFEIVYCDDPIKYLISMVPKEFMGEKYQVIMPQRKGERGTMRVNPSVQMRLNPKGKMLQLDRQDYKEAKLAVRVGDKFLWIKNDYQLNLFNGETGRIEWIEPEDGSLGLITADGVTLTVPPQMKVYSQWHGSMIRYDPRKQLELGYAVTTHKSQGSEYETVIYCMCRSHYWLMSRRNLYTGVTRAKQRVILITDRNALSISLRKRDAG